MDEEILKMKNEEILKKKAKLTEHFDPTSYPWLIMQLALVEITIKNINKFIVLAGLEPSGINVFYETAVYLMLSFTDLIAIEEQWISG